jgi:hypothetical protein
VRPIEKKVGGAKATDREAIGQPMNWINQQTTSNNELWMNNFYATSGTTYLEAPKGAMTYTSSNLNLSGQA